MSITEDPLPVNIWLPTYVQWAIFALIVTAVVCWVPTVPPKLGDLTLRTLAPPFVILVLAFTMFFGLVSHMVAVSTVVDAVTDLLLVATFWRLRVLTPYLSASFASIFFLVPVIDASQQHLVSYDYAWYSLNVIWTLGASNAYTAVLVKRGWLSQRARWLGQSLGWPVIMSGLVIVPLLMGAELEAYRLSLPETVRYSAFQVSVYIFVFYGFCGHIEAHMPDEGLPEVGNKAVIALGVALLLQFSRGNAGGPVVAVSLFSLVLAASFYIMVLQDLGGKPAQVERLHVVTAEAKAQVDRYDEKLRRLSEEYSEILALRAALVPGHDQGGPRPALSAEVLGHGYRPLPAGGL